MVSFLPLSDSLLDQGWSNDSPGPFALGSLCSEGYSCWVLFVTCFAAGMQLMLQQSGGGAPHSF